MNHQHILTGRLGQQPELRFTHSGTSVCTLHFAHDRWSKDAAGEFVKGTTLWLDITAWGELAERCSQLPKGAKVMVKLRDDLKVRQFRRVDGTVDFRLEATASTVETVQSLPRADADAADSHGQYDMQAA